MYGYHIAHERNLESIMTQGLRTDADGWDAGYVWFWDSSEAALRMLAKFSMGRPMAIIEIDLEGLEVIPDPHSVSGRNGEWYEQHALATSTSIVPSRLTVVS